jgi:hypothetical protein
MFYLTGHNYYGGVTQLNAQGRNMKGWKENITICELFKPFVEETNRLFSSVDGGDVLIKFANPADTSYSCGRGVTTNSMTYTKNRFVTEPCKDPTKHYIFISSSVSTNDDSVYPQSFNACGGSRLNKKNRKSRKNKNQSRRSSTRKN